MARDEISAMTLREYQVEVIQEVRLDDKDALRRATWKWIQNHEKDINPQHLENTLVRYSSNFAPGAGGDPLGLGEEPPDDL